VKPEREEAVRLKKLKREMLGSAATVTKQRRKRKGPKGANPLSCKKKKPKIKPNQTLNSSKAPS
jgi:hypothetical protein